MSLAKVLVFGATGAQGNPVAKELLAQNFKMRAVSRDAARVRTAFGDAAETANADLSDLESLKRAFDGVDAAFFHLPIPANVADVPVHLSNVLTAARAANLPRLVFTTSGAADEKMAHVPFVAGNIAAAEAVLASGIPAIVLKPTVYLENLLRQHIVAEITERGVVSYPPLHRTRKLSWTGLEDQARFAVAALSSETAAGRAFDIASPEAVTGDELAALLSDATGKTVRFEPLTPQQFGAGLAQIFGEDAGSGIAALYEAIDELPDDGAIVDLTIALEALPVELTPVSRWIKTNFGAKKAVNS